jgi:hypothetical protein
VIDGYGRARAGGDRALVALGSSRHAAPIPTIARTSSAAARAEAEHQVPVFELGAEFDVAAVSGAGHTAAPLIVHRAAESTIEFHTKAADSAAFHCVLCSSLDPSDRLTFGEIVRRRSDLDKDFFERRRPGEYIHIRHRERAIESSMCHQHAEDKILFESHLA